MVPYKKTHKSYSASLPRLMKVDPKLYTMFDAAMQLDSDINGYSLGKLVGKQLEEQDIMNYELENSGWKTTLMTPPKRLGQLQRRKYSASKSCQPWIQPYTRSQTWPYLMNNNNCWYRLKWNRTNIRFSRYTFMFRESLGTRLPFTHQPGKTFSLTASIP